MSLPEVGKQMRNAPAARRPLYSIGHSNHDFAHFVDLLRLAGVRAVADVRSSPYSRRLPQYSREVLEQALRAHGIAYVFLGDLLGGRPADPDLYSDGRVDYEKVRQTATFFHGLERLTDGLQRQAVAMLCAEEDPLDCHRGLMIAPALLEWDVATLHLRGDGSEENMAQMEGRLLDITGLGGVVNGLFADQIPPEERRAYLAEAYRKQSAAKAYKVRPNEGEPQD
jgi:uncharacterized protein (DUF488 family)